MINKLIAKPTTAIWLAALVLGTVLLLAYLPALTSTYLYHDDWVQVVSRDCHCKTFSWNDWCQLLGRPGGHFVLCFLYGLFDTVEQAWRARLLVVVLIIGFAFLQWIYFQALGIDRIAAICLALGTSLLPGMLVFSYWIIAGSIVFALLASTAAALLIHAALRSGMSLFPRVCLLAVACVLQVIALLIYQTAAMYLWTLTAVMLAVHLRRGLRTAMRPLAVYVAVGVISTVGYLVWFKYITGMTDALSVRDQLRGTMVNDVYMGFKAAWLVDKVLPRAAALWLYDLPWRYGLSVLIAFAGSMIALSLRLARMAWRAGDRIGTLLYAAYPFVIVTLGLLSYSPMLATLFSLETFRSMVPLSGLLFVTGAIHIGALLRAQSWPRPVQLCVALGFAIGLLSFSAYTLMSCMVRPAATEYSFARTSLLEAANKDHIVDSVHVIVPRMRLDLTTDEMYNLTVQHPIDVGPMLWVIGRDLGLQIGQITRSLQGMSFESAGSPVIDFAALSHKGLWRSSTQQYGIVLPLPSPDSRMVMDVGEMPPCLLSSQRGYNMVSFRGRVYGIPQSSGPLSQDDWRSGRVDKLQGVITANTEREVAARIPNL